VSSNDRRFENDQIYDLPALSPSADHDELLEHQQREDQWRRTREPVATGSKFLKFLTWQDLVDLRLISINDVVGNDDPDLPDGDPDVNNPDSPDFVNEPRIAVYARDMFLPVTYACSPLTVIENDPAKPNLQVLLFDPDTYESAQFVLILPKEWPGRALRYRVYWSHGSGATAYDVSWDMTVHSYEDGESMLNDWATGLRVTDTGGTANDLYISDESEAVTVNGNMAKAHDLLLFRITRLAAHETDTLDVDARLHAVEFNIGEVDSTFPPVVDPDVDPYWAYVSLLIQDGTAGDTTVLDRSPHADSTTINNYATWEATEQVFGANMIETRSLAAAVEPFTSTGAASLFGRDTGDLFTIECWVDIVTVENYAASAYFFTWRYPSSSLSIFEVGLSGNDIYLRLRNGADVPVTSSLITAGRHFIQLNINGSAYTLDVDGVEVYSGTNVYGVGLTGDFDFQVASQLNTSTGTATSTRVYVTPLRFTKGVNRARGSVPTALFPTS
jgi:hypothetical protein